MRLYVSAPSAILNFNGLLWHVVNSRLSNSENPSRVSNKMTELALLHWKDWIFTSFEDESPNMRVHCNSLQQVTVPMHCENCCNFIDNALITLQPRDCDVYQIYTRLSSPICDRANWHKKGFESVDTPYCIVFYCMVNHMRTERCPVALHTFKYTAHIVIQEVTLCNYLYTRNA